MKYKTATEQLVRSYENSVAWGDGDHEDALHEAVRVAFPGIGDDGRAELYARIADAWEGYRNGTVPRKMWIGSIVNQFMSERVAKATAGLTVHNNVKKEKADE